MRRQTAKHGLPASPEAAFSESFLICARRGRRGCSRLADRCGGEWRRNKANEGENAKDRAYCHF